MNAKSRVAPRGLLQLGVKLRSGPGFHRVANRAVPRRPTIMVAHPAADVYGSDLQLLETVTGLIELGWRVIVVIPELGPLISLLQQRGAEVLLAPFPVLRRASASLLGVLRLAGSAAVFM